MTRSDFPIFSNRGIVYLDNAATTQKPRILLDAMNHYYENNCANTNRGVYKLGEDSTAILEQGRETVRRWLGAKYPDEIIFTKGTTEAINMVASSYGKANIKAGDQIALLITEHHANLLPWQRLCKEKNAELVYLYMDDNFTFTDEEIQNKVNSKTKIVACAYVSNALGIVNPIEKIISRARQVGAKVFVDAAQAVSHMAIDVQALDIDFLAFSAHKMYGPMGIGVLYGKTELLEQMPPFLLGGDMVEYVYEQDVTYNSLPQRLEAGTQNVAGAAGLAAAIEYMENIGYGIISAHDQKLMEYGQKALAQIEGLSIIGNPNPSRTGIISFDIKGIHPHDLASILDNNNICVRAGNHCAQPLMRKLGISATTRMSFGIYNNTDDIDEAVVAIYKAKEMFGKWT